MTKARDVIARIVGDEIAGDLPASTLADEVLAALTEAGFAVVPREPTDAMIKAWRDVFSPWPYRNDAYRAMLTAAEDKP